MTDTPSPAPAGEAQSRVVGKGQPPLHSRWRAGESGNPRTAQPPLSIRTAVLERVLARPIEVQVAGAATTMSLGEAALMRLIERAVVGEVTAMSELIRLMGEAEKQRVEEARRREERSRRCAERRRARQAERAARPAEGAGAEGEPVNDWIEVDEPEADEGDDDETLFLALLALDIVTEDGDGGLRLRPWAMAEARARDPRRWRCLNDPAREAVGAVLEEGARESGVEA